MIFFEPRQRDRAVLRHDPFKAIIAPRPIGLFLDRWLVRFRKYGRFGVRAKAG